MKLPFFFIITMLFYLISESTIIARISCIQTNDIIYQVSETDTVYWFYVQVKSNSRIKEYKLKVDKKLHLGDLEKYDKDLWRHL